MVVEVFGISVFCDYEANVDLELDMNSLIIIKRNPS